MGEWKQPGAETFSIQERTKDKCRKGRRLRAVLKGLVLEEQEGIKDGYALQHIQLEKREFQ